MTPSEGNKWLGDFLSFKLPPAANVIVCPPFTLLTTFKDKGLALCAQNVSAFPEGSYTGEIAASMLKNLATCVLIGHLERRKYFFEKTEDINNKLIQAQNNSLVPLLGISSMEDFENSYNILKTFSKLFILYEPVFAVGTGTADTPQNAGLICQKVKSKLPSALFLYGGSVSPENISSFSEINNIDGVVIGKNSLSPETFFDIIKNGTS